MNRSIVQITENPEAGTSIEIVPAGGEVWMTKPEIARLLMVYQNTISNNLRAIFKAGILDEKDVVKEYQYKEGGIERITIYYSFEVIIALCYRICSPCSKIIRKHIQVNLYNNRVNNEQFDINCNILTFFLN